MKALPYLTAYLVLAAIFYGIVSAYENDMKKDWDGTLAALLCLLWPITLVLMGLLAVAVLAKNITVKIRKRVSAHWIP